MAINAPQIGTRPRRNEEEVRKLQSFPRIQWKRRSKERRELSSLIPTRTPMRALKPRGPRERPCGHANLAVPHAPQPTCGPHAGARCLQSLMFRSSRAVPHERETGIGRFAPLRGGKESERSQARTETSRPRGAAHFGGAIPYNGC